MHAAAQTSKSTKKATRSTALAIGNASALTAEQAGSRCHMIDTSRVEKIAPSYWRASQLSVARFAGACVINGMKYILCPDTDHLIREDVWKREMKDKVKQQRVAAAEKKKWESTAEQHPDLFGDKQ